MAYMQPRVLVVDDSPEQRALLSSLLRHMGMQVVQARDGESALAMAAQATRRTREDLIANTPAAGLITGVGSVNGELFGKDRARSAVMTAYVDSVTDAPLIATPPTPGRITAERTLPETGVVEWTLSNGARMLVKPTDFKADEVLFAARSPGGTSLVADGDDLHAGFGAYAVADGGLGAFGPTALRKKLTGLRASVTPAISTWSEQLGGSASRKDLETLFQLAWLRFTQPRVDTASFKAFINSVRSFQSNADNDPESVFGDTVSQTLSQHHPRQRLFRGAVLDSVDLARSLALYRQRFAGADDFTFYLVGSFDVDSARLFTARWLASLPSAGRKEQPRDRVLSDGELGYLWAMAPRSRQARPVEISEIAMRDFSCVGDNKEV